MRDLVVMGIDPGTLILGWCILREGEAIVGHAA